MSPTSSLKTGAELRRAFLEFFVRHGHTEVPSSPLVPHGDPTLMFTTAGMVQFKPYYSATGDVPYTRATSVQKCLRLTDLDNVGLTPRHDTFFEMLGNFSFGPRARGAYFKEEATAFAWHFVTKVLGLPRERLHVSIFQGEKKLPRDDDAAALWKKLGVAADHIVALGRKDNFWGPAGGAGACGPCSEIYFDLGERRPDYLPKDAFWGERPGDAGDRYMEFWNLVFPQFDAQTDGTLIPLPNPGIDTGMGIERLALILQERSTIFETDLFAPLVDSVLTRAKVTPANRLAATRDARIIADHVRALTFAIAEGALPGNEGAGYVLRRLLRRAVTRGRSKQGLALSGAFLAEVATRAIEQFGGHYRELTQHRDRILRLLEQEEAGFGQTYEQGMERLERLLAQGAKSIPGAEAFALHDTFGFPIELTQEIAADRGVTVDLAGFEEEMSQQRTRARAASRFEKTGGGEKRAWTTLNEGADSVFTGYDGTAAESARIMAWREAGEELELLLDRTPAYAESGGQVADQGLITAGGTRAGLVHVYREDDHIVHRVSMAAGSRDDLLKYGAQGHCTVRVDPVARASTQRHHTATHLLHAALRTVLGGHVHQAGSLVAPDRLRFDYSHFEAPSALQSSLIEQRVNDWVLANVDVSWKEMPLAEAKELGAMALFGEKYGERVRVVSVDGVGEAEIEPSRELCGGTHVRRTGDIGLFVITEETAVASGVRRVEALCGPAARMWFMEQRGLLDHVLGVIQAPADRAVEVLQKWRDELTTLRKASAQANRQGLEAEFAQLAAGATKAPGGRWVVAKLRSAGDMNTVRDAADKLRGALGRGAAVLALEADGKLTFLAAVTDDLVAEKKLRADELVRNVAKITGGSGGGKPHLALAGGRELDKLEAALAEAKRLLSEALA
ncbi:MAG TPA: alanine--tRNA ligase [Methylomirabilota bacterium]|nr:alanine--tRNA ligase [Methylomirabilota bacterium]